ncbi:MAG: hypothetical protein ACPMAQ_06625 [Phycisphaerae bacterium]
MVRLIRAVIARLERQEIAQVYISIAIDILRRRVADEVVLSASQHDDGVPAVATGRVTLTGDVTVVVDRASDENLPAGCAGKAL